MINLLIALLVLMGFGLGIVILLSISLIHKNTRYLETKIDYIMDHLAKTHVRSSQSELNAMREELDLIIKNRTLN